MAATWEVEINSLASLVILGTGFQDHFTYVFRFGNKNTATVSYSDLSFDSKNYRPVTSCAWDYGTVEDIHRLHSRLPSRRPHRHR